jgi:hypothetical protein
VAAWAPIPSPGSRVVFVAKPIWRTTPKMAPYANVVRARATAIAGKLPSARPARHAQTNTMTMTTRSGVPAIALNAKLPE